VGALHHPGIVAALDYLETEEHGPVFVLEFVDGPSLRSVLKISRRPIRQRIGDGGGAAACMSAAQRSGPRARRVAAPVCAGCARADSSGGIGGAALPSATRGKAGSGTTCGG